MSGGFDWEITDMIILCVKLKPKNGMSSIDYCKNCKDKEACQKKLKDFKKGEGMVYEYKEDFYE